MLKTIAPEDAQLGMFVDRFVGSWFSHPFWRASFIIDDQETLETIRSSAAQAIVIDLARGWTVEAQQSSEAPDDTVEMERISEPEEAVIVQPAQDDALTSIRAATDEMARARAVLSSGKALMKGLFEDASAGNLVIGPDVDALVEDVARSLERCRSTIINLARLKNKDEYTYLHSVAVCALMINFARQMGMDEAQVQLMGVAGLLHDVGKSAIEAEILNKTGRLSDEEFARIKDHPLAGHELLKACGGVPVEALDVALHHHERVDGGGYPHGLKGNEISLAARMGAICDIYDALTSDRSYKSAWTPDDAISRMAEWRGHLDPDLFFLFQQSIGIFPPGELVRLRSNRLAIILPNGRRGSRGKARAFFCAIERQFLPHVDVGIGTESQSDHVVSREEPAHWPFPQWGRMHDDLMSGRYRHTAAMQASG